MRSVLAIGARLASALVPPCRGVWRAMRCCPRSAACGGPRRVPWSLQPPPRQRRSRRRRRIRLRRRRRPTQRPVGWSSVGTCRFGSARRGSSSSAPLQCVQVMPGGGHGATHVCACTCVPRPSRGRTSGCGRGILPSTAGQRVHRGARLWESSIVGRRRGRKKGPKSEESAARNLASQGSELDEMRALAPFDAEMRLRHTKWCSSKSKLWEGGSRHILGDLRPILLPAPPRAPCDLASGLPCHAPGQFVVGWVGVICPARMRCGDAQPFRSQRNTAPALSAYIEIVERRVVGFSHSGREARCCEQRPAPRPWTAEPSRRRCAAASAPSDRASSRRSKQEREEGVPATARRA